ncbi:DUF2269 family protein [Paenibacillus hamazuiensis]|uniref:DUF2269 family protein n=1 Tax=Paenibacillus hamazuiensis TaxID=2936508 RepID=UPI00200C5C45|nr:DUF2269 family protein [Paenibacillus hamazuiensis]
MFGLLLILHILGAIAFIGPAFIMPVIRRSAKTAGQLQFAFDITAKLAWLPKAGGTALIVTGVWLMIIAKMGLSQMWLNVSILLALLVVVAIDGVIEPRLKKIMKIVPKGQADEAPAEFAQAMKQIAPLELAVQLLMIAIVVLMVVKPF